MRQAASVYPIAASFPASISFKLIPHEIVIDHVNQVKGVVDALQNLQQHVIKATALNFFMYSFAILKQMEFKVERGQCIN